jgi:N-acetylglucosaminyldiphosphoundecaprenol N-acetyl-beta-D-mannosaminyltransferase
MKENILGVDICQYNMEQAVCEAENIIKSRKPGFIVAINPEKVMKSLKDEKLRSLLNSADIQIPDGIGILLASKIRKGKIRSRVTGIDLMMKLCSISAEKGYSIYMLGASQGIAESAAEKLRHIFPGILISGTHDGFLNDDENAVIKEISNSGSDILFVAMGSPRQEYWINSNMEKLNVPLLMGVGGSYDVICGNIKRAPAWMRKLGMEWLYRLIKEPWRIKRMAVLPIFLIRSLKK